MASDEQWKPMTGEQLAELHRLMRGWQHDAAIAVLREDNDRLRVELARVERLARYNEQQREILSANIDERQEDQDRLRAELAALKSALLGNDWFLDCQECAVWRDVQRVQPDWIPGAAQAQADAGEGEVARVVRDDLRRSGHHRPRLWRAGGPSVDGRVARPAGVARR